MKTVFPTAQGFSGSYIVGERRNPISSSSQLIGMFVLKREYRIENGDLLPADTVEGILLNDVTQPAEFDELPTPEFIYTLHESDLSVFKPEPDIIVQGYRQVDSANTLHVTEPGASPSLWYERDIGAGSSADIDLDLEDEEIADIDANTNLFGWQPRQINPRKTEGTITTTPSDPDELLGTPYEDVIFSWSSFNNRFFNAYRRDFYKRGGIENEIASGAIVDIERRYPLSDASPTTNNYLFTLENLSISGKIFLHDGRGADKPGHWCCKSITDIHLDTLIVNPDSDTASVLWRGVWDFNLYPIENYRQLEVKVEVLN